MFNMNGHTILMINGSPHERGCTYTALHEAAQRLTARGIGTHIHWIGERPVSGCKGCGACLRSGKCILQDQVNEIAALADQCAGLIVGAPLYGTTVNPDVKALLERLFYSAGDRFTDKPGAAVIACGASAPVPAFEQINRFFESGGMMLLPVVNWNVVQGVTPAEVLSDVDGMQAVHSVGRNMGRIVAGSQ